MTFSILKKITDKISIKLGFNLQKNNSPNHKTIFKDSNIGSVDQSSNYNTTINHIHNAQENIPYISVRSLNNKLQNNILEYTIVLSNSGKSPAIITKTEVLGFTDDMRNEKALSLNENRTIINPGELVSEDLFRIIGAEALKEKYKIKLNIFYHSMGDGNKKYLTHYLYNYRGDPNLKIGIVDSGCSELK